MVNQIHAVQDGQGGQPIVRIRGVDFLVCAESEAPPGIVVRPVCEECTEQEYCEPCKQVIALRFGPLQKATTFVRKRVYDIVAVNGVFVTLRRV
jgi:hypothetical protein